MFVNIVHSKKDSCNHMEMGSEISNLADRFRIDRYKIKQIFVDETLVKIERLPGILTMDSLRAYHECLFDYDVFD